MSVAVTGGCGTVGSELVRQLVEQHAVGRLVVLDNNESELFLQSERYRGKGDYSFLLADIRDQETMTQRLRGIDILFHAAALKHVILCEQSPFEAVQTNVLGCRNVIQAARANKVGMVIFTSSDKAVNPTNVMGSSKLMGERLMSAANVDSENTIFASTRFGNVLGSRGSVIPLFRQQILSGGPITLTHPDMTRFIMTIDEAARLVLDSAALACGGEAFVTKMPVLNIKDLAEVMREEIALRHGLKPSDITIDQIGAKPGEKMYEELMTLEETGRAVELERYFVIKPAFLPNFKGVAYQYPGVVSGTVSCPYVSTSEPRFSKQEIADFMRRNGLFDS